MKRGKGRIWRTMAKKFVATGSSSTVGVRQRRKIYECYVSVYEELCLCVYRKGWWGLERKREESDSVRFKGSEWLIASGLGTRVDSLNYRRLSIPARGRD